MQHLTGKVAGRSAVLRQPRTQAQGRALYAAAFACHTRSIRRGQRGLDPVRSAPRGGRCGGSAAGRGSLHLGVIGDLAQRPARKPIFSERLVGLAAAGHRLAAGRVTLRRLAAADHVAVSRRGRTHGPLDEVITSHGLSRRVVAVVPTYTAAAHIIASSAPIGLLTAGYASQVAALTDARVYEIPAEPPTLPIAQAWHVRHDLDPPTTGSRTTSPRSSARRMTVRTLRGPDTTSLAEELGTIRTATADDLPWWLSTTTSADRSSYASGTPEPDAQICRN